MPTPVLGPAPDLATLFRYEEAIERAVVSVLTAAQISAFRSRDLAKAKSPYVGVKLMSAGATGHASTKIPGFVTFDAWAGSLLLTATTNRADPAQAPVTVGPIGTPFNVDHGPDTHAMLLGQLRVAMLYATASLTETNPFLQYHYVQQILEAGVAARVDQDADLDISPLLYTVKFGIRGTAWPLVQS